MQADNAFDQACPLSISQFARQMGFEVDVRMRASCRNSGALLKMLKKLGDVRTR